MDVWIAGRLSERFSTEAGEKVLCGLITLAKKTKEYFMEVMVIELRLERYSTVSTNRI